MATPKVAAYIRGRFDEIRRRYDARSVVEKTCANSLRVEFARAVVPEARSSSSSPGTGSTPPPPRSNAGTPRSTCATRRRRHGSCRRATCRTTERGSSPDRLRRNAQGPEPGAHLVGAEDRRLGRELMAQPPAGRDLPAPVEAVRRRAPSAAWPGCRRDQVHHVSYENFAREPGDGTARGPGLPRATGGLRRVRGRAGCRPAASGRAGLRCPRKRGHASGRSRGRPCRGWAMSGLRGCPHARRR